MPIERSVPVISRNPNAKTHVRAELEQQPLNLRMRSRFLYNLLRRWLGRVGLWDCNETNFRLESLGAVFQFARINGPHDWGFRRLENGLNHSLAIGCLPLRRRSTKASGPCQGAPAGLEN